MEQKFRLRDYPYVVVRFACRDCPRIGSYRLAVLAEKFGADAAISDVLGAISASCLRNKEKHPGRRCQAYLPDLIDPRPPDLPAAEGRRLRVIEGGEALTLAPASHLNARRQAVRLMRCMRVTRRLRGPCRVCQSGP